MNRKLNLQLFADAEKTEKATPKKRREAREEGQVIHSKEVNTAFILLATVLSLKIFGKSMIIYIIKYMDSLFSNFNNLNSLFTENNLKIGFLRLLTVFIVTILPILLISFIVSLLVNYLQVGFLFTTKPLKPKLNRLSPIEGFKRIFSKRSIVELIKSVLKIFMIGYVAYSYGSKHVKSIANYPSMKPKSIVLNFFNFAFGFTIRIVLTLVFIAILDYLYQWRTYEKDLMMTKEEIKEEFKQTEGDPLVKSKIKEKQRQLAMSRMMQDVPKADVIITNPTYIAVAIIYEKDVHVAPYLVAKGVDVVANNIKEVAKEYSIPIVENKPLAQVLYKTVEIGEMIPEELYEAVAEVLAYVYSLKDK